jgi:cation diffusion facilitator family transporter
VISGVHPDVDPRLFNESSSEDHEAGTKVTIYGIVMNIALSVGKAVAGVLGNSTAMIADAVHSMGDLGSDIVTLYTHKISARGPSPSYPYGYGRFDSLGGFVVSLLLVATGLGIGYHAALELFTASGEPPSAIALYAAAASVLVKEVLFQMTLKTASKLNSKVLIANAWHHRSDAISSGLAFLGIAGEMFGVPHMDAVAGLAVSGIIIQAAAPVIRDSLDEITDRNDFIQVDKAIRDLAKSMVIEVDRLRIRKSGNHLIAEISVSVDPDHSNTFLEQTRNFKKQIRTQIPIIQDISVELQERGMEEFHPEHGEHPPGQGPDIQSAHERVQRESKDILPKVKMSGPG